MSQNIFQGGDTGQDSAIYTAYAYDSAGNRTDTYTGGQESGGSIQYLAHTTASYDRFGNATTTTDALGQEETSRYDAYGTLVSHTDRNGNLTEYAYDGMGRPTATTLTPAGGGSKEVTEQAYTKTGQPAALKDATLGTTYYYNTQSRPIREEESDGTTRHYRYDVAGNRTVAAVLQGAATYQANRYEYDRLNRLEEVYADGKLAATYQYDGNGNRTAMTSGGTTTQYQYNAANLVTSLANYGKDGSLLSSYRYGYRLDGNQTEKKDHTGKATAYRYDRLGRLTGERTTPGEGEEATAATWSYAYAPLGNRSALWASGAELYHEAYEYDLNNRLLESTKTNEAGEAAVTAYRYDSNGNQVYHETTTAPAGTDGGQGDGLGEDGIAGQTAEGQSVGAEATGAETTEVQDAEAEATEGQDTETEATEEETTEGEDTEAEPSEEEAVEGQDTEVKATATQEAEKETAEEETTEGQTKTIQGEAAEGQDTETEATERGTSEGRMQKRKPQERKLQGREPQEKEPQKEKPQKREQ